MIKYYSYRGIFGAHFYELHILNKYRLVACRTRGDHKLNPLNYKVKVYCD